MDKKKPTTKGKLGNESRVNNTCSNTQLARLLARIKLGPTDAMNICRPSARTSKLRAIAPSIKTPNLASLYPLSPIGADLALLICLEAALWIS
jgi:hypothetical protein